MIQTPGEGVNGMAREVVLPPVDATPEQVAAALVSAPSGRIRDQEKDPDNCRQSADRPSTEDNP